MASKTKNANAKSWYIDNFFDFQKKLNGQSGSFINESRIEAIDKLKNTDFPTLKDEEWKYTNITPILNHEFKSPLLTGNPEINAGLVKQSLYTGFDSHLLVFVNGIFSEEFSDLSGIPQGVTINSLNKLIETDPDLIKQYFEKVEYINTFNLVNTAFAYDGFVVIIPDNVILKKPVQILYLTGHKNETVLSAARNLIVAGENSQAKIITNYRPVYDNTYFSNFVTKVFAGDNSVIDIYKLQNESEKAYHIETTKIEQQQKSIVNHHSYSFGGKLVRNDINVKLNGEFIESHLYGLYLGNDNQHIDTHTFIDHAKPNCMSNELYKGILDDNSRGVFSGKILVEQEAQKTNAFQSNKSILLSDNAHADSKPQLEIYADDVKCSHGATVGNIDETAYFYIRSRGVPSNIAKSMLIRAFANDVLEPVNISALSETLSHQIFEHLHRAEI